MAISVNWRWAVLLLLVAALSHAEDYVAINSDDGRDVFSGIFYAKVKGLPVKFMPVPGGDSGIFAGKIGGGHSILLIQSSVRMVSGMAEGELRAMGNEIEVFPSKDGGGTNLELAKRSNAESFILVDSAYSDSAISVLPYAVLTKSYVIFTDGANAQRVKEIVNGKRVTVYGYMDQRAKSILSALDMAPAYIGRGEDKYEDNAAIARKIMDEYSLYRPIIVDGSFIEESMANGNSPILLTGRLVPAPTYTLLKEKVKSGEVKSALIIGNGLVYTMYGLRETLRRDLEREGIANRTLGVMVQFAQAIPSQGGGTAMALDTFSVPAYHARINVTGITYNNETKRIMVGIENIGEGPAYSAMELRVKANGADYRVFGNGEVQLIERGESGGASYDLDLSSLPEGAATAELSIKYGGTKNSLDDFLSASSRLEYVAYVDLSNVTVKQARYDGGKKAILLTIKNNGGNTAFVFAKLFLNDEEGKQVKVSGPSTREMESGSVLIEEFPLELSGKELSANREITVSIDYGGRRGFLEKKATFVLPLGSDSGVAQDASQYAILVAGMVCVAAAYLAYGKLAKKKKQ